MAAAAEEQTVLVSVTSGDTVRVPRSLANKLDPVRTLLEDLEGVPPDTPIPLPRVESKDLIELLVGLDEHDTADNVEGYITEARKHLDGRELDAVKQLMIEANFLAHKPFITACARAIARKIEGLTPAKIREVFNITEVFTAAEREEVLKTYPELREDYGS